MKLPAICVRSFVVIAASLSCSSAVAGMPGLTLTDVGRARLNGISFFLMGVLGSALIIKWIWNAMRVDWTSLPELTYRHSLAMVSLIGLLMGVVLTMISGARELMTPGAWERSGLTYRLRDDDNQPQSASNMPTREERVDRLIQVWSMLSDFASNHDGKFPTPAEFESVVPNELRRLGSFPALPLDYSPGLTIADADSVLVTEPDIYPDGPLLLSASGTIVFPDDQTTANAVTP